MQARGCVLVSSSPEILCRVDDRRVVTNRPLAGTRRRGADPERDAALERELLADAKERAEHVMLVDLGRNDVGRVASSGTVCVERLMEVERYSHVMHISSTVTGALRPDLDAWDALRAALPAGTVSGAPKVRAMQAIDALEAAKRGPYGGGIGHVGFGGSMDMALGLRTMVIPTADEDGLYSYGAAEEEAGGGGGGGGGEAAAAPGAASRQDQPPRRPRREWAVHLQAGAGIVADSVPAAEYEETVNKAAALGRAIDLAEQAFVQSDGP
jgi:anthranilate synthase component 1